MTANGHTEEGSPSGREGVLEEALMAAHDPDWRGPTLKWRKLDNHAEGEGAVAGFQAMGATRAPVTWPAGSPVVRRAGAETDLEGDLDRVDGSPATGSDVSGGAPRTRRWDDQWAVDDLELS